MPPRVALQANPDLAAAYHQLSKAIQQHSLVVIAARCSVEYEGRSASRLGEGDRLIIVKPDGAVLVHRPTGYSPVNWQPDSRILRVEMKDGELVLESIRERPRERLTVRITAFYTIMSLHGLEDRAEFIEYLDESELRDYLLSHPEALEPGLRVLRSERPIDGAGYADIVARDSEGRYVVIEVKRVTAGQEAVRQLYRYVEALRKRNPGTPVRGILAAPSITKEALQLLRSLGLEYRQVNIQRIYEEVRRKRAREASGSRGLLEFMRPAGARRS